MFVNRPNLPVLVCLVLSLIVHVTVLLPLVMASIHLDGRTQYLTARFDPEDFTPPEETEPTPLGIDAETPSSMTWVGYDEYREHIAALAEMDQAAFNDDPAAALPLKPMEVPAPSTGLPVETEATKATPESELEEQAMMVSENLMALRDLMDTLGALFALPPTDQMLHPQDADASSTRDPRESETARTLDPAEEANPSEAETAPTKTVTTEPSPPVSPGAPTAGEQSDKESDATSVIDANPEHWKNGKPLASPGLEIETKKPTLTVLQSITMVARNPLCRIKFDRKGIPIDVEFIEKSGSREFDDAISASLYRWRAVGERLEELKGEETVDILIRIILRGR